MSCGVDVAVVGGGPAGSAAAIWGALSGLRVKLIERASFPRHRPGETLHPGVEPILRQLGICERVAAASAMRHEGHWVSWGGRARFERFGSDAHGGWHGYQIPRQRLDSILLERAREVGVEVVEADSAATPILTAGRVSGVRSRHATCAHFVVDAAGGRGWLRRHLPLRLQVASPPLYATYGYCQGELASAAALPSWTGDHEGWTWVAEIAPGYFHWTRLSLSAERQRFEPPTQLAALRPRDRIRGADVTWRQVESPAGNGYFLVGDAAFVLDPASSHGVLRALMSGMMAAHAIERILGGNVDEASAVADYCAWTNGWFRNEVAQLSRFYRMLAPEWEVEGRRRPDAGFTTATGGHRRPLPRSP
jgi:flavin-dependent dehydrogenase